MADRASNVVLNFRMNGQVQYAQTLKQLNMVMQTAAKEYQSQITAMGRNADATEKLRAEKQKLQTQLTASSQKVQMLRDEFEAMQQDTNASAEDLQKLYNQLLSAETAHGKLETAMQRVTEGLSEEAIQAREAKDELKDLADDAKRLQAEQQRLTSAFELQRQELGANASAAERAELANRQYAEQMQLAERAVDNLERQLQAARRAYGDNSTEVMQLEARLNQARSEMSRFGNQLDDLEAEAEQAERSLGGLGGGLAALAGAVPAAAIAGLVESTQELATELARLQSNAAAWGFSAGIIEESFAKITAVTGDTGAAVETVSNLMSTSFSDAQLAEAIELITGAYIQFSDTLSTEGIADGLQETLAIGEGAGSFAELLERSGMVLDDFNKGLATAKKNGTEADYVLQTLSDTGVKSFYESYKETNGELVRASEAQVEQQMALKELGDTFRPIITEITEFTTKLIEWANENDELALNLGVAAVAIGGFMTAAGLLAPIVTAIASVIGPMGISFGAIVGPIGLAVAAIALLTAGLVTAYEKSETFRETVNTVFEAIQSTIQTVIEVVVAYLQEKLETIRQFWDENGAQILEACENAFNGIKAAIEFVMPFVLDLIESTWSAIQNVIDGVLDVILGLVKTFSSLLTGDFKGMWEGIKKMFSGAVEAIWGILQLGFLGKIFKVVKGFGDDAFGAIKNMVDKMRGKFDEIVSAGKTKFDDLKSKIMTPVNAARDAVKTAIDKIKGFFDFDWSLPKLKLPRISIKGEFSLNPPKVPKFGIEWFAKGGIMTRPTAFGINGNNIMVGGEAGPEAVLPLNEKNLGEIGKAIAATMNRGQSEPVTILVQSVLDGKVIAESTSRYQFDQSNIKAMYTGGAL